MKARSICARQTEIMSTMLQQLCELYTQDFDLIFQRDTDPIDLFCQQHNIQVQTELLSQLKEFYESVLSGRESVRDLINMGLEYVPGAERDPRTWLPPLIKYLEGRIAASEGRTT